MLISFIITAVCGSVCVYYGVTEDTNRAIMWGMITMLWAHNYTVDRIKAHIDASNASNE